MKNISGSDVLGGYCYGPCDIRDITSEESSVRFALNDFSGSNAFAVYYDCIYTPCRQNLIGSHLSLVKKIPAREIVKKLTEKNSGLADKLYEKEKSGFNFYVHIGDFTGGDYLIIAKNLSYFRDE